MEDTVRAVDVADAILEQLLPGKKIGVEKFHSLCTSAKESAWVSQGWRYSRRRLRHGGMGLSFPTCTICIEELISFRTGHSPREAGRS